MTVFEVPPPGVGLLTVIFRVRAMAISAAVIAAVSVPELTKVVVRFEQVGEVFDVPVTVTLDYLDRAPVNVPVKLTEQVTEVRIPLRGALRKVDINRDELTIGDFTRQLP